MTNTQTRPHTDLEPTLRLLPAVHDAIDQLTKPRLIHTEIRDDGHGGITGIHTEEHPALIDLLEHGTGSTNRGRSSGIRIPIDAEAHELLKEIRTQVRRWLRLHRQPTNRDLKSELRSWYLHHDNATRRGHVSEPEHRAILRKLDGWVDRIDAKYDPAEKLEFTDPCPAIVRNAAGDTHRCGARTIRRTPSGHEDNAEWVPALEINITRRSAQCLACGTRWSGERGLMQLRYEANLAALEEDAT